MLQAEQWLLQEMERVQVNLQRISLRCARRFDEVGDVVDHACYVRDRGTDWALQQLYREELKRLEQARARHCEGRYGLCDSCGGPIELARLQAIPYATRCARCQRLASSRGGDNHRRSHRGYCYHRMSSQPENGID
jgi:RNA polymerase-binding transcription factor DksA